MRSEDIRAVENPISALFDLSEDVNKEAPRIRKLVRYATIFIIIWLAIDFILILAVIRSSLLVGIALIAIFIIGLVAISLLSRLNDFFKYYVIRHRAIMSVREDEPFVRIPLGPTPTARLAAHLASRNSEIGYAMPPGFVPATVTVKGRSGINHPLDMYISRHSSMLWRLAGIGYPGYQLMVRTFDHAPRPEEILSLKSAAEDIAATRKVPASRVIALWTRKMDAEISEAAYDILMSQVVRFSHRGKDFACSLELIIENEDGSYEFIPFVADRTYSSTS